MLGAEEETRKVYAEDASCWDGSRAIISILFSTKMLRWGKEEAAAR